MLGLTCTVTATPGMSSIMELCLYCPGFVAASVVLHCLYRSQSQILPHRRTDFHSPDTAAPMSSASRAVSRSLALPCLISPFPMIIISAHLYSEAKLCRSITRCCGCLSIEQKTEMFLYFWSLLWGLRCLLVYGRWKKVLLSWELAFFT